MGQQLRKVGQRWQAGAWVLLFTGALVLTLTLSPGRFSLAQDGAPTSEAELIELIEARAVSHAQIGEQLYLGDVYEEFKDNDLGFDRTQIQNIYEEKFLAERERLATDWRAQLPPSLWGWLVAAAMAILFLFRDALSERGSELVNGALDWIYKRIAGNPLFLNLALRKYQEALQDRLTNLDTPFKIEPPLAMAEVYVPLKIKEVAEDDEPRAQPLSQGAELDIYTAMARHKRLMVTGPPGSGKSVLLKHIAFTYGEGRLGLPGQPIPVRLELNSLRSADLDEAQFVSKLVAVLDANGFPNADRFVMQGLESGKLLLLLDGLDEVPSEIRDDVVVVINGVLEKYESCPAIVTCRTAVYEHEFDVVLDRNLLEVAEFTDYQIRNFLQAWKPRIPPEKSVEHLMQELRNRPKIKTLAGNPLLLTIVTYLYAYEVFVLPHSRAEFYEKATSILLERRDQERNIPNRYKATEKRQVLRRLALVAQDMRNTENPDRRHVLNTMVWQEVRKILPNLNREAQDTEPIIQEIIDRSGLLLQEGELYFFAHLTLQEFFVAAALQNDQQSLVERFEQDASAWREVVKLWCGLAGDSTELIRAIYGRDELLAFECLAEAQEVEQALADEIFERMKGQLERAATEDEVARAFGAVAADVKPRGKKVLEFLKEQLETNSNSALQEGAAYALSMTNLSESAYILSDNYKDLGDIISEPLIRMGDIAVEPVYWAARKGSYQAVDDLLLIYTPSAAKELARLIWNKDKKVASRAAWRLAVMLPQTDVERELETLENMPKFGYGEFDWFWLPFVESQKSKICVITGKIAQLLALEIEQPRTVGEAFVGGRSYYIDPRLLISTCLFSEGMRQSFEIKDGDMEKIEEQLELCKTRNESQTQLLILANRLIHQPNEQKSWNKLLKSLDPLLRLDLAYRLAMFKQEISKQDWLNLYKPARFDFSKSWIYWVILSIAFIASVGAIVQILLYIIQQPENPSNGLISIAILVKILFWISMWQGVEERLEPGMLHKLGLCGFFTFWQEIRNLLTQRPVWQGVDLSYKKLYSLAVMGAVAMAGAVVWAGSGFVSEAWFVAVGAWMVAFGGARTETEFNPVAIAVFAVVAWIWGVAEAWTGAVGLCFLFGLGARVWNKAHENQQREHPEPIPLWKKLIALFAFPFYCWFPITTIFSLLGLKKLLTYLNTPHPWPIAIAIWLTLFATCCILWIWGQRKDRAARNPLHGILDDYYPQYKMQNNTKSVN